MHFHPTRRVGKAFLTPLSPNRKAKLQQNEWKQNTHTPHRIDDLSSCNTNQDYPSPAGTARMFEPEDGLSDIFPDGTGDDNPYNVTEGIAKTSLGNNGMKSPPPAGSFHCLVTDPEKKGDGVYQHVTYKINTTKTDEGGNVTQSSVIRRFSDFAWLHSKLYEKYPGHLIPPLPDKAITGRYSTHARPCDLSLPLSSLFV